MSFTNQTLIFESQAVDPDTLLLASLRGEEQISGLYRFELELISERANLDLDAILAKPAKIGIKERVALAGGASGWTTQWIAGELESITQSGSGQGWTGYQAVLVPRLGALRDTYRSRVFLDQSAPKIVSSLLVEAGLGDGQDFELSESIQQQLSGAPDRASYPEREYVVQFEETDFAFVSRWLEHEGIFYVFDNTDPDVEKVQLCDSTGSYKALRGRRSFPFRPQGASSSGTQEGEEDTAVHTFTCQVSRLPKEVVLNDYNWRTPDTAMRCSAEVSADGRGVQYEYNYHYKTTDQGKALAQVVADGLIARSRVYHGEGNCRNLRAGYTFDLTDHPRSDFNQTYLLVRVTHAASQEIALETRSVTGSTYASTFQAIPADRLFRPEPLTPWPAIRGVIHAKIDGAGDGEYAELDAEGRYKVSIPFDQDGPDRQPGEASRYMRLSTPYAGSEEGMHFPLRQGAEVLLTHIDGDPDRPVIAGAVPNPNNPSLIDTSNQTQNLIQTSSGNALNFEDEEGREGITMQTANGGVYICHTRPGSMGEGSGGGGGAGSGGAAGASPRHRQRPPREGADTPGAGHGGTYIGTDESDSLTGATTFLAGTDFSEIATYASTAKTGLAYVYPGSSGSTNDTGYAKDYTKSTVITALDSACSSFSGMVGAYEIVIGPKVGAYIGNYGEWQEGDTKHDHAVFKHVYESLDPPTKGTGSYTNNTGWKRRWKDITEQVDCDNYISRIGPTFGDYPDTVQQRVRGCWITDELWAKVGTIHVFGAPIVLEFDFAALHVSLSTGIEFDFGIGVRTTITVMNNDFGIWHNSACVVENFGRVSKTDAAVNDLKAKVNTVEGNINTMKANIQDNKIGVNIAKTAISNIKTSISENKTAITANGTAINKTNIQLNRTKVALKNTVTAINDQHSALMVQLGI